MRKEKTEMVNGKVCQEVLDYLLSRKKELEKNISLSEDNEEALFLKVRRNELCRVIDVVGYDKDQNISNEELRDLIEGIEEYE